MTARGLVMLHGQLGVGSVVRPFAEGVEGRTVIVPDVRGRGGFVCRDPEAYSWPAYVDDVVALLDGAGVERAVVAGVSMGAGIALATALAHPDRVDGLVLWHPPYAGSATGWSDAARAAQQRVLDLAQRLLDRGGALDAAHGAKWARHDALSIATALVAIGWTQPFGDVAELRAIGVPTVVSPGDDDLHAAEVGLAYLDAIPGAVRGEESAAALAAFVAGLQRDTNTVVRDGSSRSSST